jgi:ribosome assembly protein YihI (activator of Der GTPase)
VKKTLKWGEDMPRNDALEHFLNAVGHIFEGVQDHAAKRQKEEEADERARRRRRQQTAEGRAPRNSGSRSNASTTATSFGSGSPPSGDCCLGERKQLKIRRK